MNTTYGFTTCGPVPHQSGDDYWVSRGKGKGSSPAGPLWRASAMLIECPYCGAPPFTRCHTYGRPDRPCPTSHSGRSWAGHEVIKRMLRACQECETRTEVSYNDRRDTAQVALDDEPELPGLAEDDIVALVNRILDERLAKPAVRKRPSATQKPSTRKRTAA